ncbi:hypothetical protein ACHAQJ_004208 [Trichoderma viride]
MSTSIWSFFGWKEEPLQNALPSPPPVTIVGVRIPADGTPAHLVPLTTISDSSAPDSFLSHVPDLRSYWTSEMAWECRDLDRLDLQQDPHIPLSHHLRQKDDLKKLLRFTQLTQKELLHLRQRYLLHQQYRVIQQQHDSCTGAYYVFRSFAVDHLPNNPFVPPTISGSNHCRYFGDVFVVKISPQEYGENGWAIYEDIVPQFLDLLAEGPLNG